MTQLTWTCHICKRERPDEAISVFKKPLSLSGTGASIGLNIHQNIRYCNDNPDCAAKAREFSFIKPKPESNEGGS